MFFLSSYTIFKFTLEKWIYQAKLMEVKENIWIFRLAVIAVAQSYSYLYFIDKVALITIMMISFILIWTQICILISYLHMLPRCLSNVTTWRYYILSSVVACSTALWSSSVIAQYANMCMCVSVLSINYNGNRFELWAV